MREFSAYPEAEMARLMAPVAMREAQRWRRLWGGSMTPDEKRGVGAAREAREARRDRVDDGRARTAERAKRHEDVDMRLLEAIPDEWTRPKELAASIGETISVTSASLYRLHEKGLVLRKARARSDITWRSL